MENFSVFVIKDYQLIMDDSVNIPSLIVNDVIEAEMKLIPEKSRKRYLKEYELFNVVNLVFIFLIFFCTCTEKLMTTMFFSVCILKKQTFRTKDNY